MQIFVEKPDGKAVTLNVESDELISSVKEKLEDKEGIPSDVVYTLIYSGNLLDDCLTLADYNILNDSTLNLILLPRKILSTIYVKPLYGKKITLSNVGLNTTIDDVKAKIYELEGIPPDKQYLIYAGRQLHGNQTLSQNHIRQFSTLLLVYPRSRGTINNREGQSAPGQLNVTSQGQYKLRKRPAPQVAPPQTKRARPAAQTTPSKTTPHSILDTNDGEVCTEYMQGLATSADPRPMSNNTYEAKLNVFALYQAKATAALNDVMPEIISRPPSSVLTELEDVKREMVTARSKEKELEATISRLTHENKVVSAQCASYKSKFVALEAENKKTKEELTVTHSKENKLKVTISGLKSKNTTFSAQCASYKSQAVALEAEDKKTKEELMVARKKEKEQDTTISRLTHKNNVLSDQCASYKSQVVALEAENKKTKELMVSHGNKKEQKATIARLTHKNEVFSAQCAYYESQVVGLEAEYKKTKEELMVADKKFYSGARATGYVEGLREGKAKWLKSVEFLHHLTDASMQYFDYGFDSCQKQAEQQGFVGQLNKDSALKEARS